MTGAPSLRQALLADLAAAGARPLHRFGQNFMVDAAAVAELAALAGAAPGQRVVEVGPGTGILTRRLLAAGAAVTAIEIDRGLAAWLATALPALDLHHGDALAGDAASGTALHPAIAAAAAAGAWTLCSNLPYDVAIPIVVEACALPRPPQRLIATVQLECAQRLASRPGDAAWGATAAVVQAGGDVRLVRRLGPSCFHPRPRVDSAIIAIAPRTVLPRGFAAFVRRLFSYRRKVLPGALRDAGMDRDSAAAALAGSGLDPARRVEDLSPADLLALHAQGSPPCP